MLRIDDIPQQVADDIHGAAVIKVREFKKSKSEDLDFFIQAAGLVWNQRARALYGIATKSRMELPPGVWHHALACILPAA